MKIINIEGATDLAITKIMENTKKELNLKGIKTESVLFPRYDELGGSLVNNHLNEFPKPDLMHCIDTVEICSKYREGKDLIFVKDRKNGRMFLMKIEDCNLYTVIGHDVITKEPYAFHTGTEYMSNYLFFEEKDDNIIKHGCKASHMTKALLYTNDRNIWFANNLNKMKEDAVQVLLVNRSWLSNFLYRTVDIDDNEEFLEYIITIMNTEVKSNGFDTDEFEVMNFFFEYVSDIKVALDSDRSYYFDNKIDNMKKFERDCQYIKTIHYNYPHLNELIGNINNSNDFYKKYYDKYHKFIEMEKMELTTFIPSESKNTSLSNRIVEAMK